MQLTRDSLLDGRVRMLLDPSNGFLCEPHPQRYSAERGPSRSERTLDELPARLRLLDVEIE